MNICCILATWTCDKTCYNLLITFLENSAGSGEIASQLEKLDKLKKILPLDLPRHLRPHDPENCTHQHHIVSCNLWQASNIRMRNIVPT